MWERYRLWRAKAKGVVVHGSSNMTFDDKYKPTDFTFKARNQEEAQRKARNIWERHSFGIGSILARKEASN